MIDRRHVLAGLATISATSPVRAKQPAKPVIGYLGVGLDTRQHWIAAFRRGLAAEGFIEGENVTIEYRSAGGAGDLLPELAADLVRRNVAVLATTGPPAVLAAKRATQIIPIVFAIPVDPVRMGLVTSFNRPSGNITGVYFQIVELVAKRLELLTEMLPKAKRVAMLVNPANAAIAEPTMQQVAVANSTLNLEIQVFRASASSEIDEAFAAVAQWRPDALFVGPDPIFNSERERIVRLAARHALPASYYQRDHVDAGGLMSYGPDVADSIRQSGVYVGRILKGAKPVDLPIQQPTKFELVVNLKTAKALGLTIPPAVLGRADEVIE